MIYECWDCLYISIDFLLVMSPVGWLPWFPSLIAFITNQYRGVVRASAVPKLYVLCVGGMYLIALGICNTVNKLSLMMLSLVA